MWLVFKKKNYVRNSIWKYQLISNYNRYKVNKFLNLVSCENDNECSGNQYCTYYSSASSNLCQCGNDRWWNTEISYCRK